jgi:LacI family gluconate utilization system Gnt-I transcriptional repressor
MPKTGSRTTGRPTLAEVARLAAVSPITASRALRGVVTVAPELVDKVREAARTLGYVANPAARTLASAQSQSVVVLIPSLSNQLFVESLEAIHQVLRPHGFEVLIGNYHYSPEEEEKLIRNYLAYQPRGILLTGFDRTENARQLLETSRVPCVHMMDLDSSTDTCSAGFSQYAAGAAAARHLIERGRRRIAYIAAQLDPRALRRGEGFREALQEAGVHDSALEIMDARPSSIELGAGLFADLMQQHPDVDGIFFCNDDLAHGAIFQAQRQGISIPHQVALVGFNDLPASAHMVPRLTSIRTPREAVGHHSAMLLLELMAERTKPTQIDLGFDLVVRESS